MATTYITLCNDLLRRLNEVTFTTSGDGFDTAKNIQAISKDAINNSIREILQDGHQFPFLKTTTTQTMTAGTGTYSFPSDLASVDWDTFYIKELSSASNTPMALPAISFDNYIQNYRTIEDSAGSSGRTAPTFVYQTAELKFGVTPIPDDSYVIEYVYFKFPDDLSDFDDTMIIPDRFKYIIIDGAMTYMMRFRSNEQSANIHQQKFKDGIKVMRRLLLDDPLVMRSTMISRSRTTSNVLSIDS
tara:strand:- start:963 stop:1694 length:732 start_codon:yes stop_codon:yes gene_type:complete